MGLFRIYLYVHKTIGAIRAMEQAEQLYPNYQVLGSQRVLLHLQFFDQQLRLMKNYIFHPLPLKVGE